MDIESFAQCLQFIDLNSTAKSSLDKYLPIITTLLGTGVGFGLNQIVTLRKEGKTKSNKVDCCYEDIHELQDICKHMLRELSEISEHLERKSRPSGHNLHSSISLPLLEKYYPEISHTFTVNQRYWVKVITRKLGEVNEGIDSLLAMRDEKSLYRVSIDVINLQASFLELLKLSLWVLAGEQLEFSEEYEMLSELDISENRIKALKRLKENAEKDDSVLGLSAYKSAAAGAK
ncbi:hypothetical protein [Pseudomonas sp. MB-090624]|uniref:hypothetical protein n=1 Tax=Pseudomonas sp. MB-090624 TaxID=2213078 RepID=UPI000D963664|nr:hypothetical protein [Pseudomonas sp. MB-090624]PYB97838.1 hypothetical protein DMX12_17725 [Pseudomonas sp. MB-090624]